MTGFSLDEGGRVLLEKQGSTTSATYSYGTCLARKDEEFPLFDGPGSERTVTNSCQSVTGVQDPPVRPERAQPALLRHPQRGRRRLSAS